MKKTLSMILSILLVLNVLYACAIGASAEKSEIENLWAEKLEYDSKYFKPEDYENPYYEYYSPESLFAYETFYPYAGALSILLYTDKADELTFSRSYAVGEGLPAVGIVPLAPVFTLGFLKDECVGTWIYCEQFEETGEALCRFIRFRLRRAGSCAVFTVGDTRIRNYKGRVVCRTGEKHKRSVVYKGRAFAYR